MPSEPQIEVYRQHRAAQERYAYFLLAAAGAAIALAVNQTQGSVLRFSQIPLATAVLLWGLSFFFGCRYLAHVEATLFSNMTLLRVLSGDDPMVGRDPQKLHFAEELVRAEIKKSGERASRNSGLQFACLILGAVLYVGWHIYEMYLRTPTLAPDA